MKILAENTDSKVDGLIGVSGIGVSCHTPQDPTSWLLYRGGLNIQWNLCI